MNSINVINDAIRNLVLILKVKNYDYYDELTMNSIKVIVDVIRFLKSIINKSIMKLLMN